MNNIATMNRNYTHRTCTLFLKIPSSFISDPTNPLCKVVVVRSCGKLLFNLKIPRIVLLVHNKTQVIHSEPAVKFEVNLCNQTQVSGYIIGDS